MKGTQGDIKQLEEEKKRERLRKTDRMKNINIGHKGVRAKNITAKERKEEGAK